MIHQALDCRLANAPDTPTCVVIHGGQFTGGVHTPSPPHPREC